MPYYRNNTWNTEWKTKLSHDDISILKFVQDCGYTTAIIAGGSVRDTYFKRPIRDIDIYVQDNRTITTPVSLDFHNKKEVHNRFQQQFEPTTYYRSVYSSKGKNVNTEYYMKNHVNFFIDMRMFSQNYQIIGVDMEPVEYVMKHFIVNISRCYCDGTKMTFPNGFLEDARQQTITVIGDVGITEYRKSMLRYIPKIKKKYYNFTLVDKLRDKFQPKK